MFHKNRGQAGAWAAGLITVLAVIIGGVMLVNWLNSRVSIEPGNVGVKFNRVTGELVSLEGPGWKTIDPWRESIIEYPVTERAYLMLANEGDGVNDSVRVIDAEGQAIELGVVVQYRVIPDCVGELFLNLGPIPIEQLEERIVRQEARSAITGISSAYGWEQILSDKRGEITRLVREQLTPRFASRCIQIVGFEIREVVLPPQLEERIAAKIQAQQEVQRREFELQQEKVSAEINRTQAQAEADRILTLARAQAEANRALAESMSPQLVQYYWTQRWDGRMPQVQGDSNPIVNLEPVQAPAAPVTTEPTP